MTSNKELFKIAKTMQAKRDEMETDNFKEEIETIQSLGVRHVSLV